MAEVQDELTANVVHVAAAKSSFRVDSTSRLRQSGADDVILPSVSSRVPWTTATTTSAANCGDASLGCCALDSSVVPRLHRLDAETRMNGGNRTTAAADVAGRNLTQPVGDASPIHAGSGDCTPTDDMARFRAALDAVDPSTLVGLRRARSKSVLVPVCRPPPAAVRFRSRGSVQCEQVARDDEVDVDDDDADRQRQHPRLFQQQQTAKASQTSAYSKERFRSASLATQRSRRSRDSASMSEMCLEYMRLNGMIPRRYPSLQQQHDDVIRSNMTLSNFAL